MLHNNYQRRNLKMPNKKTTRKRDEDGKFVSAKAIVSELGVNDTPEPNEPKVVETKNGRTITYN